MLGTNLKKLRTAKKVSLRALANLSGVSKTTISEIENNVMSNPTLDTLEKLAEALEVSIDHLTGKALINIIEERLNELGTDMTELALKSQVPLSVIQELEFEVEATPMLEETLYQIGKALNLNPKILFKAFSRQMLPSDCYPASEPLNAEDIFSIFDDVEVNNNLPNKTSKVEFELTQEERTAVQAFIETYRRIKQPSKGDS